MIKIELNRMCINADYVVAFFPLISCVNRDRRYTNKG